MLTVGKLPIFVGKLPIFVSKLHLFAGNQSDLSGRGGSMIKVMRNGSLFHMKMNPSLHSLPIK
jgi:hypothetical protein